MSKKINEQKNGESTDNNRTKSENTDLYLNITSSNIDLSEMEATEENLKNYTLSKQFLKINLDKIRELITILEEYYQSCVKKEDIILANNAKQRIILLKRIEKEKMIKEAKLIYSNQIELIEEKMKEELNNNKLKSEQEYEILTQGLSNQEQEILKKHEEEIENHQKNFDEKYKKRKPKPSKDCLNWEKIKYYALKQNKYNKVQEALHKINKCKEKDIIKFQDNKDKKFNTELKNLIHKQENEKNAFEMKKKNVIEEFNKNKNDETDKITKKYEAKLKELKNYQNFEMSNINKIIRGIIKPCRRIYSIISSATDKQNENNDKKSKKSEIKSEENQSEENKESGQKEHQKHEDEDNESDNDEEEENEENEKVE